MDEIFDKSAERKECSLVPAWLDKCEQAEEEPDHGSVTRCGQVKRKIQAMSTEEVKRELARSSECTDLDSDPSVAFNSSEFENVIQDRYGPQEA